MVGTTVLVRAVICYSFKTWFKITVYTKRPGKFAPCYFPRENKLNNEEYMLTDVYFSLLCLNKQPCTRYIHIHTILKY